MSFALPTNPPYLIAIYAVVCAALLLLLVGLLYIFCSKRYRLNWFERTLLEEHSSANNNSKCASKPGCPAVGEKASAVPATTTGAGNNVVRICCSSRRRHSSDEEEDDAADLTAISEISTTTTSKTVLPSVVSPDAVLSLRAEPLRKQFAVSHRDATNGGVVVVASHPALSPTFVKVNSFGSASLRQDSNSGTSAFTSPWASRQSSTTSGSFRQDSATSGIFRQSSNASGSFRQDSCTSGILRQNSNASGVPRQNSNTSGVLRQNSNTSGVLRQSSTASTSLRQDSCTSRNLRQDSYTSASLRQDSRTSSRQESLRSNSLRADSFSSTSCRRDSPYLRTDSSFDSRPTTPIPYVSLTVPVPYIPTTRRSPPPPPPPPPPDPKSWDLKEWLSELAVKCMAGVAGRGLLGRSATTTSGPTSGGRGAEWLQSVRKMGSSPSSPVADASEKFWVPPNVLERKRAQSLVPALSRQGSDDDAGSSGAGTPASIPPLRELSFSFSNEKVPGQAGGSDGQPSTPPAGYVPRRRASMHDAIDYTKIDARLYDKKQLVRQASVKSIEEENLGSINFTLDRNAETAILTVHIIQARNLVPRDFSGTADPYVKVCLLPDQRSSSAQSKIHRKTVNPVFEEEFIFELKDRHMDSAVLEILVYDYDQFSRDECIGCVHVPLKSVDLTEKVELWKGILPYEKDNDKDRDVGDVMFSLSYLPSAERLTVVVVKARNLKHPESSREALDAYCKVTVVAGNKKTKKKKTATVHNTNNPIWNEALVFNFAKEHLDSVALEVSVFNDNKIGNDERLGKVRLSCDSSGEEKVHWQDLVREKSASARWHKLS